MGEVLREEEEEDFEGLDFDFDDDIFCSVLLACLLVGGRVSFLDEERLGGLFLGGVCLKV